MRRDEHVACYSARVRGVYTIRTPENVSFEFELAGVGSRAVAWMLDVLVMALLSTFVMILVGLLGVVFGGLAAALYFVIAFLIQWGYGALSEWRFAGQTIGKRVVGVRVLQAKGSRITLIQAAVRNLVRIVDLLPALYFVGGVTALLDVHGRRLGDLAAGTVVVRQRRSPRPSAVMTRVDRYNSFVTDPRVVHACTRVTPPEREAMIGLALRRDKLPLAVRYALFAKLSKHLEQRLDMRRPEFFSEERFVLNLTSVVLGLAGDRTQHGPGSVPPPPP
jgi:uncharacterized RDD family membrane protein YckC